MNTSNRIWFLPVASLALVAAVMMLFTIGPARWSTASANGLGTLNVVHGVPGAEVDVCARGDITGGNFAKVITGFNFKDIETLELPEDSYDAAVVLAGNDCSEALPGLSADGLFLPSGANVSVVAHLTEDGNAFTLSVGVNDTEATKGRHAARVSVYHAAAAPAVDIRAGRVIPARKLFRDVENGESAAKDLRSGRYRLAVVPAGEKLKDSVASATLPLPKDVNTVIYAVGSLDPSEATFDLLTQEIPLEEK